MTIPVDKMTSKPKGYVTFLIVVYTISLQNLYLPLMLYRYAYIEFDSKEAANKAMLHNESLFKGRQITVIPKRKNVPGHSFNKNMGSTAQ